jgi:hypothetical protein
MNRIWRNRRTLSPMAKELGCGMITVVVFTLPLWAISAATRGPRWALGMLFLMVLVLAGLAIVSRVVRGWRRP